MGGLFSKSWKWGGERQGFTDERALCTEPQSTRRPVTAAVGTGEPDPPEAEKLRLTSCNKAFLLSDLFPRVLPFLTLTTREVVLSP